MGAAPFPARQRRILAPGAGWPRALPPAPRLPRTPAAQSSGPPPRSPPALRRLLGARGPRPGPPPPLRAAQASPPRHCPVPAAAFRLDSPAAHCLRASALAPLGSACARDVPLHVPPLAFCVARRAFLPGSALPSALRTRRGRASGGRAPGGGAAAGARSRMEALGAWRGRLVPAGGLLTQQPNPRGLPSAASWNHSSSRPGTQGTIVGEAGERERLLDERVAACKKGWACSVFARCTSWDLQSGRQTCAGYFPGRGSPAACPLS